MEKQELKGLFEAIKKDDIKSFSSIMLSNSDLNICFGRFPILSLCYLYGSYKILEKYEKLLFPIKNFVVVDEYYEIYLKFKRHAKKCLKLYVYDDKIVYPIEMLAILDERFMISKYYNLLYKNEDILTNLQKIYKINKKTEIEVSMQSIKIEKRKLKPVEWLFAGIAICLLAVVSAFSIFSYVFVKDKFGVGTASNPIKISTEQELQTAIKKGKACYILENDITLTKEWTACYFKGSIFGDGYKIVAGEHMPDGFIVNLSGTVRDLAIEANLSDKNVSENFGFFARESSGSIINCSVSGEFLFEAYNDEDVYLALIVSDNDGVVDNCFVNAKVNLKNNRSSNCYFAMIAGKNDGTVKKAKTTSGSINADTVDIAGIVGENNGTIEACENKINVKQVSDSNQWNPNTAGVCVTNNGTIKNCKNFNTVESISSSSTKNEEGDIAVLAGGIVCDNNGVVSDCRNTGKVVTKSEIALCYAGGIAARNILDETYPKLEKNKAECDIEAYSKLNVIYVGGVAGFNASEVDGCGFVGNIDAKSDMTANSIIACVGGVVGYNRECKLENSYAKVVYLNRETTKDNAFFGGVAGFVGAVEYIAMDMATYTPYGLAAVKNNHYVVDASFKTPAIGSQSVVFGGQIMSTSYIFVDADSEIFIAHEKLEDILPEVLIND